MEISVEPSKTYAVTTSGSCTVTDADGLELCTASSGSQAFFVATTPTVTVSDDGAKVSRATFNYALAVAGLLGGGDKLPAGYTWAEFLQSTGTQWIDTGIVPTADTGLKIDHELINDLDTIPLGCRNDGSSETRFYALRAPRLSSNGTYLGYGWGSWQPLSPNAEGRRVKSELNWLNSGVAAWQGATRPLSALSFTPSRQLFMFAANIGGAPSLLSSCRVWGAAISKGDAVVASFVPALTPAGEPCMFDTVTKAVRKNAGTGSFVAGMTLNQVRALRLPDGGGKLTLALPHEASIDRLAQAALERARANGWELTLQYAEAEVPAGYRKLEFLESTGTQWIDTEFTPKMGDELNVDFLINKKLLGTYSLFSAGDGENQLVMVPARQDETMSETSYTLFFRYFCKKAQGIECNTLQKINCNLADDGKLFIDGIHKAQTSPIGEVNTSLLLFKRVAKDLFFQGLVYSLSIYRAGVLQLNLIPCIAPNGTLGMYNKVDGTVKENAGSGSFIAGLATVDDVRKLWLPETGGELTVSVPADTPDSAVEQLRKNNPTWQIAIQYRTESNEN